jgi:hypothetical protein
MKVISAAKFFEKTKTDPAIIGAFQGSSWGDYNIKIYYNKKFNCGCKKVHTFSYNLTKIHFYRNTMLGQQPEMILQESGCSYINYIKMEGIFIVKFITLYSTNVLEMQEIKERIKTKNEEINNNNSDKIKKTKLMCLKCKVKYPVENGNLNKKCTIFLPSIPPQSRESDGLEIRILLCLKCKNVTSFASDPYNASGKAVNFVEYFNFYKLDKELKEHILRYEEKNIYENIPIAGRKIYIEKINKIKKIKF